MEEIVNESEDYEGQTLHEFRLIFHSISKKQRQWLVSHFQDYAWDGGLCIAQCFVSKMPKVGLLKSFSKNEADIEFQFKSSKRFENKDWDELNEADFEEILDTRLLGKEQFFSNIWYSDQNMNEKDITFFDQANKEYRVQLSKGSSITEKP